MGQAVFKTRERKLEDVSEDDKSVSGRTHYEIESVSTKDFVGNIGTQINFNGNVSLPHSLTNEGYDVDIGMELERILNEATRDQVSDQNLRLQDLPDYISPKAFEVDFYMNGTTQTKQRLVKFEDFFNDGLSRPTFGTSRTSGTGKTVAVVGGVGYGKSEMLKQFTRDVLNRKIAHLQGISVIHYMNFHEMKAQHGITPGELLFGETELAEDDKIDRAVDWISANPDKFVLVLDGADQYLDPEHILGTGKSARSLKLKSRSTKILNGILSGKLFHGIKILFSSREHVLLHFQDDVRPEMVVSLMGFQPSDIEALISAVAGKEGPEIWNHLKTRSPSLLTLCSIPMFLDFTISVLLRHMADSPVTALPDTLTELLMHILNDLTTSEHIQNQGEIFDVIHQLKSMSFHGTVAGNVVFTKKDLPEGMTEDGYKDLLVPVVGAKGRNRRLKEGHFKFLFIHESLQEALTALYIAEMPNADFAKLVSEQLHTSKWAMVRRILCGILFSASALDVARGTDPSVSLLRIDDVDERREFIEQCLEEQIELQDETLKSKSPSKIQQQDSLEMLHAIYECKNNYSEIMSSFSHCNMGLLNLSDNDLHVVATVIRRSHYLRYLGLPGLGAARVRSFGEKIGYTSILDLVYGRNSVLTYDEVLTACDTFRGKARCLCLHYIACDEEIKEINKRYDRALMSDNPGEIFLYSRTSARSTPHRLRFVKIGVDAGLAWYHYDVFSGRAETDNSSLPSAGC